MVHHTAAPGANHARDKYKTNQFEISLQVGFDVAIDMETSAFPSGWAQTNLPKSFHAAVGESAKARAEKAEANKEEGELLPAGVEDNKLRKELQEVEGKVQALGEKKCGHPRPCSKNHHAVVCTFLV